jgi:hypothetical protein
MPKWAWKGGDVQYCQIRSIMKPRKLGSHLVWRIVSKQEVSFFTQNAVVVYFPTCCKITGESEPQAQQQSQEQG